MQIVHPGVPLLGDRVSAFTAENAESAKVKTKEKSSHLSKLGVLSALCGEKVFGME